jgi:hypothetical protein
VSGACLACSGFASIEEYETDFDKHFCFDEGFDDIPYIVLPADEGDFDPSGLYDDDGICPRCGYDHCECD